MNNIEDLISGKKVLVFGLGIQGGGEGDVRFLVRHGAEVRITDKKPLNELESTLKNLPPLVTTLGEHKLEDVDWADLILVNPGVPLNLKELVYAQAKGKRLVSRTALFVEYCGIPVIGITGTRGKSTTTELCYQLLDSVYPNSILRGGNIPGISDLELLDNLEGKKYAVLELSSFQLEHFHVSKISPAIAIITNLYPDHLNRYKDMAEYAEAKSAICRYQKPSDFTLVNTDNKDAHAICYSCPGQIIDYHAIEASYPHLPGAHNYENMGAVVKLAEVLHLDASLATLVFQNYPGLPYRLETRKVIDGVTYVNDTTSTTPTATEKAIDAIISPLILILGGSEKGLPTESLFESLANHKNVKKIVVLGGLSNRALNTALQRQLVSKFAGRTTSMFEAVSLAKSLALPGDTVLLSPAFASFDLFKNEFDRGDQFNDVVSHLQS